MFCLSKFTFKNVLKKAISKAAFSFLIDEKSKLSKGRQLKYTKLQMQNYLKPGHGLSSIDSQNIFMMKMRNMFLKCNFPSMFNNMKCESDKRCQNEDSQFHLYNCKFLDKSNGLIKKQSKYEDIYTNDVSKQASVMRILVRRFNIRSQILSSSQNEESQRIPEATSYLRDSG